MATRMDCTDITYGENEADAESQAHAVEKMAAEDHPKRGRQDPTSTNDCRRARADWCVVCQTGGDINVIHCNACLRMYHLQCHVPDLSLPQSTFSQPIESIPSHWTCLLCSPIVTIAEPTANSKSCDQRRIVLVNSPDKPVIGKHWVPPGLTDAELQTCERILLLLLCQESGRAFHQPPQRGNIYYYKVIRAPMNFMTVKKKLWPQHYDNYLTLSEFINDINLVFSNCLAYNQPGSEICQCAITMHGYFVDIVRQLLPNMLDLATRPK